MYRISDAVQIPIEYMLRLLTRVTSRGLTARASLAMADDAVKVMRPAKRAFNEGRRHFKPNKKSKKGQIDPNVKVGSNEEVLVADVQSLLGEIVLDDAAKPENANPHKPFSEVEVAITKLSSTGDGLGLLPGTHDVAVVPFTAPGDKVLAKVIRHVPEHSYTITDLVKVVQPSSIRDDSLVRCPYFASCSGCQFQMLPYSHQLAHKKTIVEKAYRNFSKLDSSSIPPIGDTIGSPLEYGYRTKLTPHFDGPPGGRRERRHGSRAYFEEVPPIGFMLKNTRRTLDIEDCPIATQAVRNGMKRERQRVKDELQTFQRGVTLLLRESTERVAKDVETSTENDSDAVIEDCKEHVHRKTCITDQNAMSNEYIDNYRFENVAGSFFQNNNSILPAFTQYVRENIIPSDTDETAPKITHLIDAYCGSGLFTITLSSLFTTSIGIDISSSSIQSANRNAKHNNLDESNARFITGDANDIFAAITSKPEETAVVLDPSRKGCDDNFLKQLLKFSPARICYVSCNVHTQAIDIGKLVSGIENMDAGCRLYEIESLRGFDFFPQTGHVEGVAFLRKAAQ